MVNRKITLSLLLLFIITSCTLTTELPNLVKGRWAYSKDSDGIAAELYSFNDKMEYTHITTKIDRCKYNNDSNILGAIINANIK